MIRIYAFTTEQECQKMDYVCNHLKNHFWRSVWTAIFYSCASRKTSAEYVVTITQRDILSAKYNIPDSCPSFSQEGSNEKIL